MDNPQGFQMACFDTMSFFLWTEHWKHKMIVLEDSVAVTVTYVPQLQSNKGLLTVSLDPSGENEKVLELARCIAGKFDGLSQLAEKLAKVEAPDIPADMPLTLYFDVVDFPGLPKIFREASWPEAPF